MYPILFEINGISIPSYGFMASLGFLFCVFYMMQTGKRLGLNQEKMVDYCIFVLVCSLAGARLLHVLIEWEYYSQRPAEIMQINSGGLVFYGGFLAGILSSWIYLSWMKFPFFAVVDGLSVSVCFSHVLGRIGCYLYGCCYGMPVASDFLMAVKFPGHDMFRHPSQLYESFGLLIIFFIMLWIHQKGKLKKHGSLFALYLTSYAALRFILEYTRGDARGEFFGMSTSQLIAIGLFAAGVFILKLWPENEKSIDATDSLQS